MKNNGKNASDITSVSFTASEELHWFVKVNGASGVKMCWDRFLEEEYPCIGRMNLWRQSRSCLLVLDETLFGSHVVIGCRSFREGGTISAENICANPSRLSKKTLIICASSTCTPWRMSFSWSFFFRLWFLRRCKSLFEHFTLLLQFIEALPDRFVFFAVFFWTILVQQKFCWAHF